MTRPISQTQRAALIMIPLLAETVAGMRDQRTAADANLRNAGRKADDRADAADHANRARWRLEGAMIVLDVIQFHARGT